MEAGTKFAIVVVIICLIGLIVTTVVYLSPRYNIGELPPGSNNMILEKMSGYMEHENGRYTGPIILISVNRSPLSLEAKWRFEALEADYWWVDADQVSVDDAASITTMISMMCYPIPGNEPIIIAKDKCISDFPDTWALYDGIRDATR